MEVLKMEAKVDIRKLQLLNDRVCQTIDALNQVRMSVHGLGQTSQSYAAAPVQFVPGLGHTTGYNPAAIQGAAVWPQLAPSFGYAAQQFIPGLGLGHTTGYAPAILPQFGSNAAYNPLLGQAVQQPAWPLVNQGYQNVAGQFIPGLSHTTGLNYNYNQSVPFNSNFAQSFNPNLGYQAATASMGINNPWTGNTGLSHTTADMGDLSRLGLDSRFSYATAMDPYGVTRLIQTFPFAQYPSSPVF